MRKAIDEQLKTTGRVVNGGRGQLVSPSAAFRRLRMRQKSERQYQLRRASFSPEMLAAIDERKRQILAHRGL